MNKNLPRIFLFEKKNNRKHQKILIKNKIIYKIQLVNLINIQFKSHKS